jgi:hypothetical protein
MSKPPYVTTHQYKQLQNDRQSLGFAESIVAFREKHNTAKVRNIQMKILEMFAIGILLVQRSRL